MAWLSLRVAAGRNEAEAVSDALLAAGALSVSIEDRDAGTPAEEAQFGEPGLDDPHAWQRNWVVALLPEETPIPALLREAGLSDDIEYRSEALPEQDWVRLTQAQFTPIRISDRLWIVPSWHAAPRPEAVNLVLDPGLAFGTGSHPTTRLCLCWLERTVHGGETLLDYGCGSGILAIAAARLGAARVVGVDIDPQAVAAARANAERNGIAAEFRLPEELPAIPTQKPADEGHTMFPSPSGRRWPEGPDEGKGAKAEPKAAYDLLVANILTNPLRALAPLLAARVRPGGRVALSGILEDQATDLLAVYAPYFDMALEASDEGWALLTGVRK